jgi:hypothetical protein
LLQIWRLTFCYMPLEAFDNCKRIQSSEDKFVPLSSMP